MQSVYAWFWTYWGVLVISIVVGLVTTVIGAYYKEEEFKDTGLFAFGVVTLTGTLIFGIIWALAGPFSVHWILIPVGVISIIMFFVGLTDYEDEPLRGSLMILVVIGLAYLVTFSETVRVAVAPATFLAAQKATEQNKGGPPPDTASQKSAPPAPAPTPGGNVQGAVESVAKFTKDEEGWWKVSRGGESVNDVGGGLRRVSVRDFWPTAVSPAPQGFLATSDGTAVRVLASSYLVPLFERPDTVFPGGVVEIMKPFRAYYVIRKQDAALLVAEPPFTPNSRTFWARQSDCYVWATGLAVDLRGNAPLYASEEQARASTQPLTPADKYISTQRLPGVPGAEESPALLKLPLLLRTGELAAILSPANGGELCWVNLARAGDSIALLNGQ
jgi:hypothetical protein